MKASLSLSLLIVVAPLLGGQSRASRQIDSAYAQARTGRLDSAQALLRPLLDSSVQIDPRERASAFVVYGITEFFMGRDSTAAGAFHAALDLRLDLRGDLLYGLDPSLGRLWQRERRRVMCGLPEPAAVDFLTADTVGVGPPAGVLTEKPRVLSGPRLIYPEHLRRARVQGRVVVAAVIDTSGRAERGSIKIVQSPHRDFSEQARHYAEEARFQPARMGTRPVRICIEIPVDFRLPE